VIGQERTLHDGLCLTRRIHEMEIVDFGPHSWFLIQEGESLLLDVNCSHGAVDYDFQIELNESERAEYVHGRRNYLDRLAHAIHYSAPGVIGSTSAYKSRRLEASRAAGMQETILTWVKEHDQLAN